MKTLLYLLFILINTPRLFAQTTNSVEMPIVNGADFVYLGESNEFFYYASIVTPGDDKIKVSIQKFNSSTLELLETKDVFPRDFVPKEYVYHVNSCKVKVVYKNSKFYFFFTLAKGRNQVLFVKTLDVAFSNEKNLKIGGIDEKIDGNGDSFQILFSNDDSKALVILQKEYLRATKAFGVNVPKEFYQHSELFGYDLINDEVLFVKPIPEELQELKLKSDYYQIDNEGNVIFLIKLAEATDEYNKLRQLLVGYFKIEESILETKELDISGMQNFYGRIMYLKNDDFMFVAQSGEDLRLSYISISDPAKNFDKSINCFSNGIKEQKEIHLGETVVTEKNIYFTFSDFRDNISALCISIDGNVQWGITIPLVRRLYEYRAYNESIGTSSAFINGNLHILCVENKPYEITPKIQKELDQDIRGIVYDLKKFETVLFTIDQKGDVEQRKINDKEDYYINPIYSDFISSHNSLMMVTKRYKKTFFLKKMDL
ncbi:hypothetical protein D3C71_1033160 [compost metagenome]